MTKLRTARQAAGLTQAELARRSGVAQTTISRLEDGLIAKPLHATVQRICRELGVEWTVIVEFRVNGGRA